LSIVASVDEVAREQAILLAINTTGRVVVNALAEEFGVSTVTIRKDLDGLASRFHVAKISGCFDHGERCSELEG